MWLKDSTPTVSNIHTFSAKLKRPKIFETNLIIADFKHSSRLVINAKIDFSSSADIALLHHIVLASKIDFDSIAQLVMISNLEIAAKIDFSSYADLLMKSYLKMNSFADFSCEMELSNIKNIIPEKSVLDFDSSTDMNLFRFTKLKDFYQVNNNETMNWMYGQTLNELFFLEIV